MSPVTEKNGVKNVATNGGNAIWKTKVVELSRKWARQYPSRKILWGTGFVLAILGLITFVVISCRAGKQLQQSIQAVTHTGDVLEKLENITAQLTEVESAARSFA